jgi:hypothetical protein
MQLKWKIIKIGQFYKMTNGKEDVKIKNAVQVVTFCQKLSYIPEGIESIPKIYQNLIIKAIESKNA